jgi:dihydropteroate synthase
LAVINLTPDSFSDGGRYASSGRLDVGYARDQALALLAAGAAGLDVGGESTRPGAAPVDEATELARVLPLLEALEGQTGAAILSIDTQKARVAELALERGVHWINDVSAGSHDPAMLGLAARRGCHLVLMHRRGAPQDMQRDPRYWEPVAEVAAELRLCLRAALEAGVKRDRILLDPGIGFGKRLPHNLALLARLGELRSLGAPLLLGASRKSFLGQLSGQTTPALRLPESLAAASAGALAGAAWLRVHDVAETRAALSLAGALGAGLPSP